MSGVGAKMAQLFVTLHLTPIFYLVTNITWCSVLVNLFAPYHLDDGLIFLVKSALYQIDLVQ